MESRADRTILPPLCPSRLWKILDLTATQNIVNSETRALPAHGLANLRRCVEVNEPPVVTEADRVEGLQVLVA